MLCENLGDGVMNRVDQGDGVSLGVGLDQGDGVRGSFFQNDPLTPSPWSNPLGSKWRKKWEMILKQSL